MFNNWASFTGALSKREKQKVKKERSKSHCDARNRLQSIPDETRKNRSYSNMTSRSAPAHISLVKADPKVIKEQCIKHGFTPRRIEPNRSTSILSSTSISDIKDSQMKSTTSLWKRSFSQVKRKRTLSGGSKSDVMRQTNEKDIDLHAQIWRQAYTFACR